MENPPILYICDGGSNLTQTLIKKSHPWDGYNFVPKRGKEERNQLLKSFRKSSTDSWGARREARPSGQFCWHERRWREPSKDMLLLMDHLDEPLHGWCLHMLQLEKWQGHKFVKLLLMLNWLENWLKMNLLKKEGWLMKRLELSNKPSRLDWR